MNVTFDNVTFKYHYDEFALFDGLSFTVDEPTNSVWCDVQSGKGTLCKLLTGELKPDKGKICFDGIAADGITAEQRGILYLTNKGVFFEHKSVARNVEYPLAVRKTDKKTRAAIVAEVLDETGLADLAEVKVCKLTEEQRRLVALARGLTVPRKVVLFDDFFVYDRHASTKFDSYDQATVAALWNDATKIILTADKRLLTGKSVVLDGGKCVFCGAAEQAAECADKCVVSPYTSD